jgi:hypothetical protein
MENIRCRKPMKSLPITPVYLDLLYPSTPNPPFGNFYGKSNSLTKFSHLPGKYYIMQYRSKQSSTAGEYIVL